MPIWIRVLPPLATVAISLVFLYANPYVSQPLNPWTIRYVYLLLILPALLMAAACLIRNRILQWTAFVWSLPAGLYLGLAGVPSWWTWLLLAIALYLLPDKRKTKPNG